jgi:cyclin-dependent kinase 8/11
LVFHFVSRIFRFHSKDSFVYTEKDWPGVVDMPEYQNMKRLDPFSNRLHDWCQSRIRMPGGYDFLRQLFAYDPDSRLTAKEALQHKWFQEDPKPTWKYVLVYPLNHNSIQIISFCSAFQSVPAHQIPPHRRITQDEAPSMMAIPAQHTSHQGGLHGGQPFAQSQSKPGSTSSFGSLSGGAAYGQATGGNGTRGSSRKKARRI